MDEAKERESAFKVGFLTKLAELGLAPDAFFDMTKEADILEPLIGGMMDAGSGLASEGYEAGKTGLKYGIGAALAAPLVIGGAAGMGQALLDAPGEQDISLMRQAEMAGLYTRLSKEIQERRKRKLLEGSM